MRLPESWLANLCCAQPALLVPYVGANLDVMEADRQRMRPSASKPYVMTNLKTLSGVERVVSYIETKGMLTHS
jgi:urease accessory protein